MGTTDGGIITGSMRMPACHASTNWHAGSRATDGRVPVLPQWAVVSVLPGSFRADFRQRLPLPGTVLRYSRLGRALDAAALDIRWIWVRQSFAGDRPLFHLDDA